MIHLRTLAASLALIAALCLSACQGGGDSPASAPMGAARQSVVVDDADTPSWMDVASGSIRPAVGKPPKAAYIEGMVNPAGRFQPTSHVLGEYTCLCGMEKYMHQLTTGWLDLRTGQFVKKTRETHAEPPYLLGQQDETGEFHPDTRAVAF